MKKRIKVRLTYPLPLRQWFPTNAGWASREWTPKARQVAEAALWKWRVE